MKFPGGFGGGGGMAGLMAQAQKMQTEMKAVQEKASKQEIDVASAGGRIQIRINGKQEILSLSISKELIDPNDAALLSDLVKVATNDAIKKSQEMVAAEMSKVIPPGLAGMF